MSGLAILCSGQGRQDWASFEALLKYPDGKVMLERLRDSGLIPETLENYLKAPSDNSQIIFNNEFSQPFIVIYHIMLWEILKKSLPKPELFAGYSLGELSLYGLADIIKSEELLKLAVSRGRLMTQAAAAIPQAMVAVVGINYDKVKQICGACDAYIAIINAADHFVAGLPADKMNLFIDKCSCAGASRTVHLPVSIASHTPYMEKAALEFNKELRMASLNDSSSVIISGISGERLFSKEDMINALTGQISHAIDWRACMESTVSYGCRVFLETGPGNSLSKMLMELFPDVAVRSVSDFHDINAIGAWVNAAIERQY